ncbi:HtaA domain-containing protein [Baekduia sp. Peel2402]|uniref:HtaA domain-containing protein n=1 Tax=Baekduia sp. Peel2402 TaxID=3458296 RepID=UPI00403EC8D0
MTSITTHRLAVALIAVGAAALPAAAQAGTVKSATLDWTQYNVYDTGQPAGTDRTWLGYVTSTAPPSALGSATPIAPATGDTVTPASTRGTGTTAPYTTVFPATSGTYDATDGTGAIELDGGLDFQSSAHGFDITVEKPKLVLDGFSGKLYASGKSGGATPTYDRSQPLFSLDLTNASVTLKADGSRVISGIVPSLASAGTFLPSYAVGAGPNRTPNTFGSFSLTVKTDGGDQGPKGDTGAAGANGKDGAAGKNGASATIRTVKAVLAKAPYTGSATRKVTVYSTANKKLATGTLKGRVLKVTLADKVTSLSGKVKVKVSGAKSSKTVSIPS